MHKKPEHELRDCVTKKLNYIIRNKYKLLPLIFIISAFLYTCHQILFSGYFIWDDKQFLFDKIITGERWAGVLMNSHYGLYHPLTTALIKLTYITFSNESIYLHALNLFLHIINSVILLKIFLGQKINPILSTFLFAIFLFHPVNIETYVWITSIKDQLANFFVLFSFYYYLKYRVSINYGFNKYFITVGLLSLFAMLSKPSTVFLPFALYFIEVSYQKRLIHSTNLRLLILLIPVSVILIIVSYFLRVNTSGIFILNDFAIHERILIAVMNWTEYTIGAFGLTHQSVFYPYPFKPDLIPPAYYGYLILPFLLMILYFFIKPNFRVQYISLLAAGLLILLPVLQLIPIGESIRNDRYSYLYIAYILVILALGITHMTQGRNKRSEGLLLISLFLFLMLILFRYHTRLNEWKSSEKLLLSDLKKYPSSEILSNTTGVYYLNENEPEKAIKYFNKAIIIDNHYSKSYNNLGKAYFRIGNTEGSIQAYKKSIIIFPLQFEAFFELSALYYISGNYATADSILSIRFKKDDDKSLNLLGKIKYQLGDIEKSVYFHEKAVKLRRSEYYLYDLAICYGKMGQYGRSLALVDECIEINSHFAEAYYLKGIIAQKTGKDPCILLRKALSLGYSDAGQLIDLYCP